MDGDEIRIYLHDHPRQSLLQPYLLPEKEMSKKIKSKFEALSTSPTSRTSSRESILYEEVITRTDMPCQPSPLPPSSPSPSSTGRITKVTSLPIKQDGRKFLRRGERTSSRIHPIYGWRNLTASYSEPQPPHKSWIKLRIFWHVKSARSTSATRSWSSWNQDLGH